MKEKKARMDLLRVEINKVKDQIRKIRNEFSELKKGKDKSKGKGTGTSI
jgi:chaperonin cofactor prefoldin